jgi:hydrogenase nickel incorporation protein HypA/HybF
MHEHHQVDAVVKDLLAKAAEKKATKITKVSLKMGELLGFDEMSVRLYFETFTENTIAEQAELEIVPVKGQLHCAQCQQDFVKEKGNLDCPICKKQGVPTQVGKEFFVAGFESI